MWFLVLLAVYLVGAVTVWRFNIIRVRTRAYEQIADCQSCLCASEKIGAISPCSFHQKHLNKVYRQNRGNSFRWPIHMCLLMAKYMGLLVLHIGSFVGTISGKVLFPNGMVTGPERRIMEHVNRAAEQKQEKELRQKLRTLGINDRDWLPVTDDEPDLREGGGRTSLPVPRRSRSYAESEIAALAHLSSFKHYLSDEMRRELEQGAPANRSYGY